MKELLIAGVIVLVTQAGIILAGRALYKTLGRHDPREVKDGMYIPFIAPILLLGLYAAAGLPPTLFVWEVVRKLAAEPTAIWAMLPIATYLLSVVSVVALIVSVKSNDHPAHISS